MSFDLVTLVRLFLTLVALALTVMALLAWRRRRLAPEAPTLALLILSAAIYSFGYAGEVAQTTLSGTLFWLHVEYLGIPWIPALWLLGARKQHRLGSRDSLLFAIPLLAFVAQQTTPLQHLYDHSMRLVARGPFWVMTVVRSPIAWLFIAYLNFALLYGAWLYVFGAPTSARRRVRWLMAASSLVPLAGYLVFLLGRSPWGLDLAPLLLSVSVVLAYIAVFRYGCIDLIPMAHSLVFQSIRDPVLVADLQHRLVDFNPAARQLLPCLATAIPGDNLEEALDEVPALAKVLAGMDSIQTLDLDTGGEQQHFNLRIFPLISDQERSGTAVILADNTAQVRLVHELRQTAETDALTGVANRRRFLAAFSRECARASRHREPLSVALVDMDGFKSINDRMGHLAGDRVLRAVADRILQSLRASDLLSRYGGDEFAILLPRTNLKGAIEVAERVRKSVAASPLEIDNQSISFSISIGVAAHTAAQKTDWEQLLNHADMALYDAKAQGRNRVAAWRKSTSSLK